MKVSGKFYAPAGLLPKKNLVRIQHVGWTPERAGRLLEGKSLSRCPGIWTPDRPAHSLGLTVFSGQYVNK